MKQFIVTIDDQTHRVLRVAAAQEGCSMASMVRPAIEAIAKAHADAEANALGVAAGKGSAPVEADL